MAVEMHQRFASHLQDCGRRSCYGGIHARLSTSQPPISDSSFEECRQIAGKAEAELLGLMSEPGLREYNTGYPIKYSISVATHHENEVVSLLLLYSADGPDGPPAEPIP